ncbi:MAG: RluA family pseudouridine synthase [Candidatus Krumholzibacteria bacterium]|nr:RluA family pseudouridine synthase [Candidatus Krumholzibacteria bacterium]
MTDRTIRRFIVDEEEAGERLDSWLSGRLAELSRSRVQKALAAGEVLVDGLPERKASRRVRGGARVELEFSPPAQIEVEPEEIPLDVVYEDEHLIVVDKRAGMVVHPAPGNERGTLVNALLARCGDLSGIGGYLRPGIVHRLDALTSGLIVAAKTDEAHIALGRQLMERSVRRIYLALVWGEMGAAEGEIDAPIGRNPKDRKKMAVVEEGGREALTRYRVLDTFPPLQYIECALGTGRTHQIRVHLSHAGHPVFGDPVYGGRTIRRGSLPREEAARAERALRMIDRQALHAARLSFTHPVLGERMTFEAPLPADFRAALEAISGDR